MKIEVEFPDDFMRGTYNPIPVGRIHLACGHTMRLFFRPEGMVAMVPKSALCDTGIYVVEDDIPGLDELGKVPS